MCSVVVHLCGLWPNVGELEALSPLHTTKTYSKAAASRARDVISCRHLVAGEQVWIGLLVISLVTTGVLPGSAWPRRLLLMRQTFGKSISEHLQRSSVIGLIPRRTRSTGTVHTSANARLTSAAIWRISMSSRFMSVDDFPYLPVVTNPENNPVSRRWSGSPPKFNRLFNGPLPTFSKNLMPIHSEVFAQSC